jgi:hypothetical protein
MLERAGVASNLKDSDLKGPTEVREKGEGGRKRERVGRGTGSACMKLMS